jgi:type IV secretory pathway VirB4 component
LITEKELDLETSEPPQRPKVAKEFAKYLQTDQGYARVLVSYAYSTKILEGSLGRIDFKSIRPELFELVVQFQKISPLSVRNYLNSLEVKKQKMARYASSSVQVEEMLVRGSQLKKDLDEEAADPLKFRFIFIIHAKTTAELESLSRELIQVSQENGILLDIPCCAQREIYEIQGSIGYRVSSNVSLSKFYPLAGFSLVEPNGVFLGTDDKGSPIAINPYLSVNGRQNPHWSITGTTGAGKTTTGAVLIDRLRKAHDDIYVIVIDPMSNYNKFFQNEADLNIVFRDTDFLGLDPVSLANEGVVSSGDIADFLIESYGIPAELRGILVSQLEQSKSLKELMDNLENLAGKKFASEYRKLENFLLNMTSGADKFVFQGRPPELKGKKFVILGLNTEDTRKKRLASTMLMFYAYSLINKLPRDVEKLILIDEAHFLFEYQSIAKIIAFIYRTARALRTSMITMTQLIQHYNMNNYSREAWQLAENKLILKQEKEAKDDLIKLAHLSEEEIDYILKSERGRGILRTGAVTTHIQIQLTEDEKAKWRTE